MANIKKSRGILAVTLILVLLVIDQVIKIWVKTNMPLYDTIEITSWFKIHYIENNGMAFGMTFVNKLVLSLFRIAAIVLLCYYISLLVRRGCRLGYLICVAIVTAGAAGNIFDSMFYGLIFSGSSPYYVSYFVPFGDGYAPFLMGKVVDMFYFPLIESTFPDWVPFWGGENFVFFSPVFNFADACVSVGVVVVLLFYQRELTELFKDDKPKEQPTSIDSDLN
ncbi:MAG: lipoprotein signal peptidase [Prevotella sp.]|nr:lipoprotein signal peptidase [Prevotella sp.]MBP3218968.1 lipoprotein signal peptidase [Prevotella sp.]